MKSKQLLAITALSLMLVAPAKALMFGIRYSDIREQRLPAVIDNSGKNRFGIFTGIGQGNSVFLVGADYDRAKTERGDSLLYFRRFTVNFGYRYNILSDDKAKAMNFMPFLALHYFKSFSKVEADSMLIPAADVKYYNDMLNDNGGWLSVGQNISSPLSLVLGQKGEYAIRKPSHRRTDMQLNRASTRRLARF